MIIKKTILNIRKYSIISEVINNKCFHSNHSINKFKKNFLTCNDTNKKFPQILNSCCFNSNSEKLKPKMKNTISTNLSKINYFQYSKLITTMEATQNQNTTTETTNNNNNNNKINLNQEEQKAVSESQKQQQKPKSEKKPKEEKPQTNTRQPREKKDKSEKASGEDQTEDAKGKLTVKVVKGARDFMPYQMSIRNKAFSIITAIFRKHGAVEIDTPVFELKETLMGKYGEESKLIYDLQNQGGELLSLRYDLTVPFARYMAVNSFPSIKRFHIGKVYRRDQPQMSKGRFREFYQCDFDIAGPNYGKMIPDAEILKVLVEILSELKLGKFSVKLNHRKLLDATVSLAGIAEDKFKIVCSSVDKLDKEPWEAVKKELLEKGLDDTQTEKLWELVQMRDAPWALLKKLNENAKITENVKAKEALEEMSLLFEFLDIYEITDFFVFDLSLARGLDYYTGLIYEAVLTDTDKVGSIAAGGRYDDLLGMFSNKSIPAVGVSIGIERVFNILEEKMKVS